MPTAAMDTIKLKEARRVILVSVRRFPKTIEGLCGATLATIKSNGPATKCTHYILGHHHNGTAFIEPESRLAVLPWTMVAADAAGRLIRHGASLSEICAAQSGCHATEGDHIGTGPKKSIMLWVTSPVSPCARILQAGGYWRKENDTADPSS